MKKYRIVAETHEPYEMAQIKVNNRRVFMGNLWDFHPGCYGTSITIGYGTAYTVTIDLADVWSGKCSPKTLASLIALKLNLLGFETVVETKQRKTPIEC